MGTTPFSFLVVFSLVTTTKAITDGFAIRLIHRDSPEFPFYNPHLTTFDRIISAVNRSMSRLNYFNSLTSSQSLISDFSNNLVYHQGEYMMIFKIGSPPTTVHAVADTGSEVTWVNCLPCKKCDPHSVPPIFNPSGSSSFTPLRCGSNYCPFDREYEDGSKTKGYFGKDDFIFEGQTLDSTVRFHQLKFACGEQSSMYYQPLRGIVGLSRNRDSLVAQLGITKFSHCMVMRPPGDNAKTVSSVVGSRMYFGSMAIIAGGQTPFNKNKKFGYYLTLDGISVGDEKLPIPEDFFDTDHDGSGDFIIDSGTEFTCLKTKAFDELVKLLKKPIQFPELKKPINGFEWCFRASFKDMDDSQLPAITLHLRNADVILDKQSIYINLKGEVWCLAIFPSRDLSILGNFQQTNYWVGYDLEGGMVSFAPVDCSIF